MAGSTCIIEGKLKMADQILHVEPRELRGKRHAKRLRQHGKIPGVLYGHGKETVAVSILQSEMAAALRHNAHLVQLQGAADESALLKEIQWDAFGNVVLHVDLTRVRAGERVEVALEIQLRGMAPGTRQGGVVEHPVHTIEIECPATGIPESLTLNINNLELGQSLTAADLELPPGAKLLVPEDTVIVSCEEPVEIAEEEEGAVETAEPEVIGRKEEEGDSGDA